MKKILALVIINTLGLLIFSLPLIREGINNYADNSPIVLNIEGYRDASLFVFNFKNWGLAKEPVNIMMQVPLYLFFLPFTKVVYSPNLLSVLWMYLPFCVFINTLFAVISKYARNLLYSFLGTLFVIFSPPIYNVIFAGWYGTFLSLSGGVLLIDFSLGLYKDSSLWKNNFLKLLIAFVLGFINIAFFYSFALTAGLLSLIAILYIKSSKQFISYIGFTAVSGIILFVGTAFWLLPFLSNSGYIGTNYGGNTDPISFLHDSYTGYLNNLGFGYVFNTADWYVDFYSYLNHPITPALYICVLILVFYFFYKKKTDKFSLGIIIVCLLVFDMSLGHKAITYSLFSRLPLWELQRVPIRFYYPFLILISLLLVRKEIFLTRKTSILLQGILSLTVLFNVFVFTARNPFIYFRDSILPKDYVTVYDILNKSFKLDGVISFPELTWYSKYSWVDENVYEPNIHSIYVTNPLVMPVIDRSFTPVDFDAVYDGKVNTQNMPNFLGRHSVRYVLVNHDYSEHKLKMPIEFVSSLEPVYLGKDLELWKIPDKDYIPLVSSSTNENIHYFNPSKFSITPKGVQTVLHLNTPYNKNWAVYETGGLSCTDSKQSQASKKSKITICSDSLLTSLWDVRLLFSEPKMGEGKPSDIYRNSFNLISDTGDRTFVLYYMPQLYMYAGLIVTTVGFIITLLLYLFSIRCNSNKC